jgi:hypothetical protein
MGLGTIVVGLAAGLYVGIAQVSPGLPQPETVGGVVLGVISLALLTYGAYTFKNAGRVEGHVNLRHVRDPMRLAKLEAELASEPETWGEFSFTPSFLLAPDFVPIPLDQVVWAFRREVQKQVSRAELKSEMCVFLASGESETFEGEASDIEPAFDCLFERRPQIRIGYDEELHERWKLDPKATAKALSAR